MSEIEKLYKNAGVKPYIYCSKPQLDCDARETGNCKQDCEYYSGKRTRITFTAEKQLELIKWLINFDYTHLSKLYCADINFSVVLAATINYLWKCLSKSEQEQIKRILE